MATLFRAAVVLLAVLAFSATSKGSEDIPINATQAWGKRSTVVPNATAEPVSESAVLHVDDLSPRANYSEDLSNNSTEDSMASILAATREARSKSKATKLAQKHGIWPHRRSVSSGNDTVDLALLQSSSDASTDSSTGWGNCYDAHPGGHAGWKVCHPGYYITGFRRGGCDGINCVYFKCCKDPAHNHENAWGHCYNQNVWSSMDRMGWNGCGHSGFFVSGYYKTGGNNLYNLEVFRCCKPMSGANYWRSCYAANWWRNFDYAWHWGLCGGSYYLTHLWRNRRNAWHEIELGHCCSMAEDCRRQLTCKHGGTHARNYGPPCYCRCHNIWYGRDCGLELQRDCHRGWVPGMPRWSPAGSLNHEIFNTYFKKAAESRNIPLTCMHSAYSFDMSKFPGVSEIKKKVQKLASRQGRTNGCIARSMTSGILKSSRSIPMQISQHLGLRAEEVIEQCASAPGRMKLLIDIYMMPGENQHLFRQARAYLELTMEMPWERLYRLRQGHKQHLNMESNHQTRELGALSELLKKRHLHSRNERRRLANTERDMSRDHNDIMNGLGFQRHTTHAHNALKDALRALGVMITKWKKKAKELQISTVKRFHQEDRVMMKDTRDVENESQKQVEVDTEHLKEFFKHLRKANASFYRKLTVPVRKAILALVRFILRRHRIRFAHKMHVRKLRWDLKREEIMFKGDVREFIRQGRKRTKDATLKTAGRSLRDTLAKLKTMYSASNRQMKLKIDENAEMVARTKTANGRMLKVMKNLMEDENKEASAVKAETGFMRVKGANEHRKMMKDYMDMDTVVSQATQDADQKKKTLERKERSMFTDLGTKEEKLFQDAEKKDDNKSFKSFALKDLDELQAKVDEQVKSMSDIVARLEKTKQFFSSVEHDIGMSSGNSLNTVQSIQESIDSLRYKVPSEEVQQADDDLKIHERQEECEKDSKKAAVKSAITSATREVNEGGDMRDLAQVKASIEGMCKKESNSHSHHHSAKDAGAVDNKLKMASGADKAEEGENKKAAAARALEKVGG